MERQIGEGSHRPSKLTSPEYINKARDSLPPPLYSPHTRFDGSEPRGPLSVSQAGAKDKAVFGRGPEESALAVKALVFAGPLSSPKSRCASLDR